MKTKNNLNNKNITESFDQDLDDEILEVSKTKRKQQMEQLQDLGVELIALSKDQLAKFNLSATLLDAILLAQKINSNGAIRRQRQYIGKLMRDADIDFITNTLSDLRGESSRSTKLLHVCEKWRDLLLADDLQLNKFVEQFGNSDINELRQMIRQVRKERENLQNKNYRNLFQLIRNIVEKEIK